MRNFIDEMKIYSQGSEMNIGKYDWNSDIFIKL